MIPGLLVIEELYYFIIIFKIIVQVV